VWINCVLTIWPEYCVPIAVVGRELSTGIIRFGKFCDSMFSAETAAGIRSPSKSFIVSAFT